MPSFVMELAVPAGAGGAGGGGAGAESVTEACAVFALLAALAAVMVKLPGVAPAVKSPEVEIVPPVADQVTLVFDVPVTVAANCWVPPVWTAADAGLTTTEMVEVSGGVVGTDAGEPVDPVQPANPNAQAGNQMRKLKALEAVNCRRVGMNLTTLEHQGSAHGVAYLLAESTDFAQSQAWTRCEFEFAKRIEPFLVGGSVAFGGADQETQGGLFTAEKMLRPGGPGRSAVAMPGGKTSLIVRRRLWTSVCSSPQSGAAFLRAPRLRCVLLHPTDGQRDP